MPSIRTKRPVHAAAAVLAAMLAASCSSKGSPPVDPRATVSGRLVSTSGAPIAGALICAGTEPLGSTATDGSFRLRLAPGAHRLSFSKDGVSLAGRCLAVAETAEYALGDVAESSPTGCAAGVGSPGDTDGDGLTDAEELAGWEVTVVDGDGRATTRHVASDPFLSDTDGDGLRDGEERSAGTDPARGDTDGDGLSDLAELTLFKSDPRNVDTDGDSRGPAGTAPSDPNLWDGNEVLRTRTSPTLADTDGDGLADWQELHSGGTSPLVADLPSLALEVYGDPLIQLDTSYVQSCSAASVQLARTSNERVDTDVTATKMSVENTVSLHTEVEAGTGTWPPTASAKLTTDTQFKHAWSRDTSTSVTDTSAQESQKVSGCWDEQRVSFANGRISTAIKLTNRSDLTFKVKDLGIIAYQILGGGSLGLVGTMDPEGWPTAGYVLGPASELVFTVQRSGLGADTMRALTRTPSALLFEVGAYSLFQLDDWGVNETVNYAKLGESVVQRTGMLSIDDGTRPAEHHMIATNVYRNPDGTARGVTLREALATLGIPFQTDPQVVTSGATVTTGPRRLTSVREVSTYRGDTARAGVGYWVVAGTGPQFDPGAATTDFESLVLRSGERVSLVYMQDTDLDGLSDREERLLGTDPARPDTDGDGLSDFEENKLGWVVESAGLSRQVYSDPRFADPDGDYLTDATERSLGTDPYRTDTDGDGLEDSVDPDPRNPPCLRGSQLGMVAWWDGSAAGSTVADLWVGASPGTGALTSSGVLYGTNLTPPGLNGTTFSFNPLVGDAHQYVEVASDASLSPTRDLTLSVLVNPNAHDPQLGKQTILAKGTTGNEQYALYLEAGGTVAFTLTRLYYQKCWFCCFGATWCCVDGSCADATGTDQKTLRSPAGTVASNAWTLLTATFSGETMRLYKEGVEIAQLTIGDPGMQGDGQFRYQTTTTSLVANDRPLRIGVSVPRATTGADPFSGRIDEVQLFSIGLTSGQIDLYARIHVCDPAQAP